MAPADSRGPVNQAGEVRPRREREPMRHLWWTVVLALLCGCQPRHYPDHTPVKLPPKPEKRGHILWSQVVCRVDPVTIPRSRYHELECLLGYTESGGIYGPDEKLMVLNGLRMVRSDTRFRKQFTDALDAMRGESARLTMQVRFFEGRSQFFNVGGPLRDHTLFAWDGPDSVLGRHFRHARFRMSLSVARVRKNSTEIQIAWQMLTGAALNKPVSIPSLTAHVEVETGQSVVVAPADFSGRGVGRAFLTGVEESAVGLTFFVITPTKTLEKTEPADGAQ